MIRLAVSTEYRRVTDGQTDKHHATALFALYIASRGKQLQFCHCFHYYVAGHLFSCTLHCQCYNCLFVCLFVVIIIIIIIIIISQTIVPTEDDKELVCNQSNGAISNDLE